MTPAEMAATVSPHILNILLKRARNTVALGDTESAVDVLDQIVSRPFESEFFNDDLTAKIKDIADVAIMHTWVTNSSDAVYDAVKAIRSMLDPIFIHNLWLANRILGSDLRDIGTLDELPELVLFEIRKILYTAL